MADGTEIVDTGTGTTGGTGTTPPPSAGGINEPLTPNLPDVNVPTGVPTDTTGSLPPAETVPEPDIVLVGPAGGPPNATQALTARDTFDIVPFNFGLSGSFDHQYHVGLPTAGERGMAIRNKAIDRSIIVAVVLPEFLTMNNASGSIEEVNGVLRAIIPPRQEVIFSVMVNELAALNLTMQRQYEFMQEMSILAEVFNVTGPVWVRPWGSTESDPGTPTPPPPIGESGNWYNSTQGIFVDELPTDIDIIVCPPLGNTFYEPGDVDGLSCIRRWRTYDSTLDNAAFYPNEGII